MRIPIVLIIFLTGYVAGSGTTYIAYSELSDEKEPITDLTDDRDDRSLDGHSSTLLKYKKDKCLIINKWDCPPGWCPPYQCSPGCQEDLAECETNLEGIKEWCDPACHEALEECYTDLRNGNNCYSRYYIGSYWGFK
jgi:hypothetical protein